ncbi:10545_t:CDS:2 [Diversispora eburnea]|uniref:10545_t:CDS:1 n=1 Tax=Diversispora eburnea TaxID=1213867 RepID=A0A9N8VZN9_9GLOM|nr:10545_t:CDS:2 [Diversispora eburnea]
MPLNGENTGDTETEGEEVTPSCESEKINPENYDLGLHVGSLFVILVTSSFGAFLPVITKRNPKIKLPRNIYFVCKHFGTGVILATSFIHMIPSSFESLTNECLGEVWTEYSAWAGAIAMMAALFVFFIEYMSINKQQTLGVFILEVGLGLGSRIAETSFSEKSIKPWLMALVYGTTTPIGIAIGIIAHESYDPGTATAIIVQGVLDSVSAGILLYVALVELIAHDFIFDPNFRKKSNLTQTLGFVCLTLGAGSMAVIGRWA